MGQSICKGSRKGVIETSRTVDDKSHHLEKVLAVDESLDISRLPLVLPFTEEDAAMCKDNSVSATEQESAQELRGTPGDADALSGNARMRNASLEESSELDRTNCPIRLDEPPSTTLGDMSGKPNLEDTLKVSTRRSQVALPDDDVILDRTKYSVNLGEPCQAHFEKLNNCVDDASQDSKSFRYIHDKMNDVVSLEDYTQIFHDENKESEFRAASPTLRQEERIEESSFNQKISNGIIKASKCNDSSLAWRATDVVGAEAGGMDLGESTSEHQFVTNKTDKFSIMDILAQDYMRNDEATSHARVDMEAKKEILVQETFSDSADGGLKLLPTKKFAVYDVP